MRTLEPEIYLLDVEGTIAPVSLVSEVLFPFARTHLEGFLGQEAASAAVAADLALLAEENAAVIEADAPRMAGGGLTEASAYLNWLMARDRKSTALKSLQGKIWKSGFESGELKGTLFEDVPEALERWAARGRVAIYSSGSAEAQRLLFRYSNFGDLTERIAGYFDTRVGPKTAQASYAAIAGALGVETGAMLFLSDVVRELDPARAAGCGTRLVIRAGNAPVEDDHGHERVGTLRGV